MRKFILSAVVAVTTAVSFAAPSQAGGYDNGYGHHNYGHHNYGYNKHHYNNDYGYESDYGYEPVCYIKKIKKWDQWGNVYFKKIKICD